MKRHTKRGLIFFLFLGVLGMEEASNSEPTLQPMVSLNSFGTELENQLDRDRGWSANRENPIEANMIKACLEKISIEVRNYNNARLEALKQQLGTVESYQAQMDGVFRTLDSAAANDPAKKKDPRYLDLQKRNAENVKLHAELVRKIERANKEFDSVSFETLTKDFNLCLGETGRGADLKVAVNGFIEKAKSGDLFAKVSQSYDPRERPVSIKDALSSYNSTTSSPSADSATVVAPQKP